MLYIHEKSGRINTISILEIHSNKKARVHKNKSVRNRAVYWHYTETKDVKIELDV